MGKARKKSGEGISLFPFMSVLASVIGILMLLIAALVISAMDTDDVAAIERAEEAAHLDEEIDKLKDQTDKLAQLIALAEKKQQELALALEEYQRLKNLQSNADQQQQQHDEAVKLLAQSNTLKQRIDQITQELPPILEQIAQLKAELAKRDAVPREGTVRIFPAGSGNRGNVKPSFVECTAEGLVLLTDKGEVQVRTAAIRTDPQFLTLVDSIAKAKDRQLIFLIRNNAQAIDVYKVASLVARQRQTLPGRLPVVGNGKIDLSLFNIDVAP